MEGLFWLLLPVAAYSGWYAATRCVRQNIADPLSQSNFKPLTNYSEGVVALVADNPDKAVDIVIDKVDVSPDTVEVHLALGNLFRRNGEVSRAIRLHQNLTEKHSLTSQQRESVLYELGQDYLSAGLFDRAERIFIDLITSHFFEKLSIQALIEVYQQEQDWDSAITFSKKYEKLTNSSQKKLISQFYCEMAERKISESEVGQAQQLLDKALKTDKTCVRANLLMGGLEFNAQKFGSALAHYRSILDSDSGFLPEIMDNLVYCIQVHESNKSALPLFSTTDAGFTKLEPLQTNQNELNSKAIKFIERELDNNASIKLLGQYLHLVLDDPCIASRALLTRVKKSVNAINEKAASYRCNQCGLSAHSLHWQCPSCLSWNNIKPL